VGGGGKVEMLERCGRWGGGGLKVSILTLYLVL
jgi:hypothetical protein